MLSTVTHVLFVFIAFALSSGVGILVSMVTASGDVRAIRVASRAARPLHIAGGIALLLGIIFGFATAARAGFALNSQWLVITYVLVAGLLVLVGGFLAPWTAGLERASASSPDDQPSPELRAAIAGPGRIAGPIAGIVWLAIIVMMVLKP